MESDGTQTLTPSEARAIFGDTLEAVYYDGSDYQSAQFRYDSVSSLSSGSAQWAKDAFGFSGGGVSGDGESCLVYTANFTANTNPSFITVRIPMQYSFFDTEELHIICGLTSFSAVSPAAYSSPSWLWYKSDVGDIYSGYDGTAPQDWRGVKLWDTASGNDWFDCTAAAVNFSQSSTFSCYSKHVSFYGNSAYTSGTVPMRYYFFITLPKLSASGSAASGSFTATTGGGGSGDVNVSVNVEFDDSNIVSGLDALQSQNASFQDSVLHADVSTGTTIAATAFDLGEMDEAQNDIWDDLPALIASGGFWLALLGAVYDVVPVLKVAAPVLVLLSVLAYVWWRK